MSPPQLRIGDQEREAAVSALGEHYVSGRLTKQELDDRSAVAWKARTNSGLAPLFVDLPRLQRSAPVPERTTQGSSSRGKGRRMGPPVLPLLLLVVVVAAVSGLEVWPFLLLIGVYLWLRAWMGVARMHRWARDAHHRVARGSSVEPWRPGPPWR